MKVEVPSRTARKVALNIVTLGSTKQGMEILPRGVTFATADLLRYSGVVGRRVLRFAQSQLALGIFQSFGWMMPGQLWAMAHRKAFCELQVRKGIEEGVKQVLLLGAGFDTLAWRLAAEFADVSFFEADHQDTAHFKAKGFEAMGRRPNHHLGTMNLRRRQLVDVPQPTWVWKPSVPSVVVAEGLLMYLPPRVVMTLLRQCSTITGPGSRLVFTYVGTRRDGRPDVGPWTRLKLRNFASRGEPWLWSARPDDLSLLLLKKGWEMDRNQTIGIPRKGFDFYGVAVKR